MVARDFRAIESSSFLLIILRIAPFTVLMEKSRPVWRERFCLFERFEDRSLSGKEKKKKTEKKKKKSDPSRFQRQRQRHQQSNVNRNDPFFFLSLFFFSSFLLSVFLCPA